MSAVLPPTEWSGARAIVHRTRGSGEGPIVRLMSPSDLGRRLRPFVFLDLFDARSSFAGTMAVHPHSGIATATVITEGDVRYDDPDAGVGTIGYGGVEWMRAGGGVWHGQEMSAGVSSRVRGFQLWVALPPELENGPTDSQYVEACLIPQVGPARIILGSLDGIRSPIRSPQGTAYLLVTLRPGERWVYTPSPGMTTAFVAMSRGAVATPDLAREGELVLLAPGTQSIPFEAVGETPSVFVLGASVPHPHELHLGDHSVHTSLAALQVGKARIVALGEAMQGAGSRRRTSGVVPVFR